MEICPNCGYNLTEHIWNKIIKEIKSIDRVWSMKELVDAVRNDNIDPYLRREFLNIISASILRISKNGEWIGCGIDKNGKAISKPYPSHNYERKKEFITKNKR